MGFAQAHAHDAGLFAGKLQAAAGGEIELRRFTDDARDRGMAQPFLHHRQDIGFVLGFGDEEVARMQTQPRESGGIKFVTRGAPQHVPFQARGHGGGEGAGGREPCGGRRARDLMQGCDGKTVRPAGIHFRHAEGQSGDARLQDLKLLQALDSGPQAFQNGGFPAQDAVGP